MASQKANTKKTGSWDLPLKVIKTGIVSWLIVFLFWGLGSLQYDEIFLQVRQRPGQRSGNW